MTHWERKKWCEEINKINKKLSEDIKNNDKNEEIYDFEGKN